MNCCEKEMKDLLGALDEFVKAANKNYENVIAGKRKGRTRRDSKYSRGLC